MKLRVKGAAVAMGMLLFLTGCGGSSSSSESAAAISEAGAAVSSKKVTIILPMDHLALNEVKDAVVESLTSDFGDRVTIDVKNANGDSSLLSSIVQEAVSAKPDVLLPVGTGAAQVAATTTKEIPIVFSAVTDPIAAGLCPSWDKAGSNVTGVSDHTDPEQIVSFSQKLFPQMKTVGLVYTSSEVNSGAQIEEMKTVLKAHGLQWKEGTITNTSELQQVVENLATEVDAFFVPADNNVAAAMPTFQQVALKAKKPIFTAASSMVESGGTLTCGFRYRDLGKKTAEMIKLILEGKGVSEIPPQKIKDVVYIVNEDQEKELGFSIPADLSNKVTFVKTKH